jgi:predicted DNA-binding transcriptional regulator YafY
MAASGRSERLFRITELLAQRRVLRACDLAGILKVSERTIYRDMHTLVRQGVPIIGEAGAGYMLRGQRLGRPLALSDDELEALVLGLRIVTTWGDVELAAASASLLARLHPRLASETLRRVQQTALVAPLSSMHTPAPAILPSLRRAVRQQRRITFEYVDAEQRNSVRTVRPLSIAFFATVWSMVGWCELRNNFRSFRIDRIRNLTVQDEHFASEPGKTLLDYLSPTSLRGDFQNLDQFR